MKTKKLLYGFALLGFAATLTLTGCDKKKEDPKTEEEPTEQAPDGQSGTDNREVQGENDAAVNDINEAIGKSTLGGKSGSPTEIYGICGFDIDSVKISKDTILLKYNGITCNNRTRTGNIRLTWQHGTKWKNQGAVIKVEYMNYKIVRASDKRSIMLNGIQNLTNVSGGNWVDLLLVSNYNLVNTVTGTNLSVTFEDGKTATYNINRKLTYTYPGGFPNGILTLKAEGIGSNNGVNNLENYGTARNGDVFTSQVTTPIVWNVTCGGAVLQGAVIVKNVTRSIDLTFTYGVDASGNIQTVGPNSCPYGWKLEWSASGTTHSKVFGYY